MIAIATKRPQYSPGQIVRHRRYAYRGVVVAVDQRCMADEDWYQSNATRPDRKQPWYHVLVDAALSTTYVAEENLLSDPAGKPIDHPLLEQFFDGYVEGRYVRNEEPWAAW